MRTFCSKSLQCAARELSRLFRADWSLPQDEQKNESSVRRQWWWHEVVHEHHLSGDTLGGCGLHLQDVCLINQRRQAAFRLDGGLHRDCARGRSRGAASYERSLTCVGGRSRMSLARMSRVESICSKPLCFVYGTGSRGSGGSSLAGCLREAVCVYTTVCVQAASRRYYDTQSTGVLAVQPAAAVTSRHITGQLFPRTVALLDGALRFQCHLSLRLRLHLYFDVLVC